MTVRWSPHGVRRDVLAAAFCDWFGIEVALADVLIALFDHQSRVLSWQELASLTDSHRPPTQHALQERLSKLRRAMESESIDCIKGVGYCLTEVGIAECRQALAHVGARLGVIAASAA